MLTSNNDLPTGLYQKRDFLPHRRMFKVRTKGKVSNNVTNTTFMVIILVEQIIVFWVEWFWEKLLMFGTFKLTENMLSISELIHLEFLTLSETSWKMFVVQSILFNVLNLWMYAAIHWSLPIIFHLALAKRFPSYSIFET